MRGYINRRHGCFSVIEQYPIPGSLVIEIKEVGKKQLYYTFSERGDYSTTLFMYSRIWFGNNVVNFIIDFKRMPGLFLIKGSRILDGMTYPSDTLQLVDSETSGHIIRLAESLVHQDTLAFYKTEGFK